MPTVYACEGFQFIDNDTDLIRSLNDQLGNTNSSNNGAGSYDNVVDPYGVTRQVLKIAGNDGYIAAGFSAGSYPVTACISCQTYVYSTAVTTKIMQFLDGATVHVYLSLVASGGILIPTAYRGDGTVLGTSPVSVAPNEWHQYSFKVTIDDSAGVVSLYQDGVQTINVTGADTRNGASAQITHARMRRDYQGPTQVWYCDFVVSDDHFSNQVRVLTLSPNADGDDTGWTASAGSRYACLDDLPRSATDYIYSATATNENSIKVPSLSVSGTILTVVDQIYARKSDVDARSIKQFVKSGGSKSYGSAIALSGTDTIYARKMDTNPVSASAWTSSDFGASGAQFGQKVES